MVPHQTHRGRNALNRLKVFEGCPPPYDNVKRLCVPIAMKVLCLRSDRKFCKIGRVAHEVGWQYKDVVANLEAKRKIKSRLAYLHKKKLKVSVLTAMCCFCISATFKCFFSNMMRQQQIPYLHCLMNLWKDFVFWFLFFRHIKHYEQFYSNISLYWCNHITFLYRPSQERHAPRSPKRSSHRMQFLNNTDILQLRQSKKILQTKNNCKIFAIKKSSE